MQRLPSWLIFAMLIKATPAMSQIPADFSERLDKLWEFSKPAESEQRFRAELAKYPAGSREALETSTQIMLKIHHEGRGVCGLFTKDIAATKVELVLAAARRYGHPLQCIMEAA